MITERLHTVSIPDKFSLSGLMHAPRVLAKQISRRQEFRRAFIPLLQERDQILADIGYQRYDILRAERLPLREDAMTYIESKRLTRPTEENQTRLTR